jgi:hypothetical protein
MHPAEDHIMNKFILAALACTALGAGTVLAQQNSAAPVSPSASDPAATDSSASYQTPQTTVGTTAQTEQKGSNMSAGGTVRSGGSIPNQYDPNDKDGNKPKNAAINTNKGESRTAAAPVPGRNSFTEGEARNRIEKFGYSNVTGLTKDADGIWRGTATKNGATGDVALDYQGNIVMGK